jgi:hypothetical protein
LASRVFLANAATRVNISLLPWPALDRQSGRMDNEPQNGPAPFRTSPK